MAAIHVANNLPHTIQHNMEQNLGPRKETRFLPAGSHQN